MEVTYLDHMGSDLTVVNAARVSFGKRKDAFDERDARLVKYLVQHGHVLPFRHPHISFHFKAPIFVARQLVKHQVGMSWSEISRRYVTGKSEFFMPEVLRQRAEDKKQGSLDASMDSAEAWAERFHWLSQKAISIYDEAVEAGMAPEQARMILPLNSYTEWHWTGSLLAWAHLWKLRVAHDAQKETQDCVRQIGSTMERLFPISWKELTNA